MLLAVMFLLVGVPNAPGLSTNVPHLGSSSSQTFNGTASTETSRLKSTSKDIPSAFRPGTMMRNSTLEKTNLCIASVIPDSTPEYVSHPISSTRFVSSSVNHIDSTPSETTRPTIAGSFATIRNIPPTTTRRTSTSTESTPPTSTRRTHRTTSRRTLTTMGETTEDHRATTELSRETSLEVPTTFSQERSHIVRSHSMSEVTSTALPRRTTYPVPPQWSDEKAPTSMTYSQTRTTLSESPTTLKPITFRTSVSTLTHRKQTTLRTFIPLTTTTNFQNDSSTSLQDRLFITSTPILALPKLTEPLSSQNQRHADMLGNGVQPMRHLPWNSQETTTASFENDFGNVFHSPSVFPQKATISLKNGGSYDAEKATTPSLVVLRKPDAPNPDYYKYTTTSTLPVLNLLGNKRLPHTTSAPVTGASIRDPGLTVPLLPAKTTARNQSVFSSQRSSIYPKLPRVPTRDKSQPNNQKIPYNVPPKDKNQSVPHSVLPPSDKRPQVLTSLRLNETLPPERLPTIAEVDIAIVNLTQNCSNDYCVSDEDYIDMMLEYMFPTEYEWVLIGMHSVVFIGGLVGNALVCLAVYRNHSMRTVTNYFIVNLAVADFLVILLCLPPTVLWDVTETWFMGTALCKIVLYFQTVSVAVSVLTLTFISIDRWYAICCPLKFKSTTGRAKKAIVVIWVLALAFDIPEMIVLQTKRKELNIDTIFFTQCEASWSDKTDMAFHCLQTILLYTIPLVFMSIAYYQIVRVLWSSDNIPGHKERLHSSGYNTQSMSCRSNTIATKMMFNRSISNTISTAGHVICRRKAAKMLVAVVIMFAVCYFPVHLLSILRYIYDIPQTDATTAFSMVSHWLCYANSAVNPLIYNFMSGKFRKEFASTFGCRRFSWKRPNGLIRRRRRRQVVASLGDNAVQPTEMAPLSRNGVANVAVDVENRC